MVSEARRSTIREETVSVAILWPRVRPMHLPDLASSRIPNTGTRSTDLSSFCCLVDLVCAKLEFLISTLVSVANTLLGHSSRKLAALPCRDHVGIDGQEQIPRLAREYSEETLDRSLKSCAHCWN